MSGAVVVAVVVAGAGASGLGRRAPVVQGLDARAFGPGRRSCLLPPLHWPAGTVGGEEGGGPQGWGPLSPPLASPLASRGGAGRPRGAPSGYRRSPSRSPLRLGGRNPRPRTLRALVGLRVACRGGPPPRLAPWAWHQETNPNPAPLGRCTFARPKSLPRVG